MKKNHKSGYVMLARVVGLVSFLLLLREIHPKSSDRRFAHQHQRGVWLN